MLIYNYKAASKFCTLPPLLPLPCNIVRLCPKRFCKPGSSALPTLLIISIQRFYVESAPKSEFSGKIKRGIIANGGWQGLSHPTPQDLLLFPPFWEDAAAAANAGMSSLRKPVEGVGWPGLEGPRLMNLPELLLAQTSFSPVPPPPEGGMGRVRNDVETPHITTDSPLSLSHHTQCNGMAALLNLILAKSLEGGQHSKPFQVELQHFVCWHFAFALPQF